VVGEEIGCAWGFYVRFGCRKGSRIVRLSSRRSSAGELTCPGVGLLLFCRAISADRNEESEVEKV